MGLGLGLGLGLGFGLGLGVVHGLRAFLTQSESEASASETRACSSIWMNFIARESQSSLTW